MKIENVIGKIRKEFSATTEGGKSITIAVGYNQHSGSLRPFMEGCFDENENQIIQIGKNGPGRYDFSFKTDLNGYKYFKVSGFEAAADYLYQCLDDAIDYSKNDYGA